MSDLRLPPGPPLPPEVRERALRSVLSGMDDDESPTAGRRARRLNLLLAVAVVIVVAAATGITVLGGTGADGPTGLDRLPPAATDGGGRSLVDPLPAGDLPAPSGDPATDAALTRCAAAVVHAGRAAEYPATREWHATSHVGTGATESDLVINESFACLVTPASVAVSGLTGTPAGPVQVVRMSRGQLLVLNPQRLEFRIGVLRGSGSLLDTMRTAAEPVEFVDVDYGEQPSMMRLEVTGYSGPVPEPVQALVVVDRDLQHRPDTPEWQVLRDCLDRLPTHVHADPTLWMPLGWHIPDADGDGVDEAPRAIVTEITDIAAGYCILDPLEGPIFVDAPLPPGGTTQPVVFYRGASRAILLTVAPDVTSVEVTSADSAVSAPCTILDRLAMCTIDTSAVDPAPFLFVPMVVTAFTSAAPQGFEVYRN